MFVFSNLATSLDGKIATASRVHFPLGTAEDRRMMQVLRRKSDAILMGASTLRAYRKPLLVSGRARQSVNVVVSGSLAGISPSWPFFKDKRIRRILFVGPRAQASRVSAFGRSCEVIRLRGRDFGPQIVRALSKRGLSKLLVEGGGTVMWDFARGNLITEYYVTLTPRILGGTEAPTLVDGPGFSPKDVLNLKLVSCRRKGSEIYLRYRSL